MARNPTIRRFCFTFNNYDEVDVKICEEIINKFAKYGIFGKEVGQQGTPHLQGFVNLERPMRFNKIKELFGKRIHIEKAIGSDEQNQVYCSKSGEFFEKGNPSSGSGQRSDIDTILDAINNGIRDEKQLAREHGRTYIRYFRGIRAYLGVVWPSNPRDFKTDVYYYYGPPGSGKSRRALQEAKESGQTEGTSIQELVYYKPRGLWWDGYCGQPFVIVDDFYGWIKYDELLKICDRYPYKVQIKGGFVEFVSKKIWFTSNVDTHLLYKFDGYDPAAFERRITNKVHIAY